MKKQVESIRKNKHFGISYYAGITGTSEQPFAFSIFSKSVLCDKVGTLKCVSVQTGWTPRWINQNFMEFIRFTAERSERKNRMEVNC